MDDPLADLISIEEGAELRVEGPVDPFEEPDDDA